jgi:hypothetical protein
VGRTSRLGILAGLCFLGLGGATGTARTFVTPTVVLRGLASPRETAVAPNGDLYFTQFPSGQLSDVITLSRLPGGSTKPVLVYRVTGIGASLTDIHFDSAGNLLFVTRSGPSSTVTRLDATTGKAVVLAKASGVRGPGANTGMAITLDDVDEAGTVYFTRVSTDPQTKAQTADLFALDPGSSTPRQVAHFAGAAGADDITFLTVRTRGDVFFVESPSPNAGSTLYQLTPTGRRVLVRGAAPGAGFTVAAAAFDGGGNLNVLTQSFTGFVRFGCATSTTLRVSKITATDLAVGGTPALQTVGEGTYEGYVGLWAGPYAYWPSSAVFRVSDGGDVYWLQSPMQSRCSSDLYGRLSDQFAGLAATDKTPTILFTESGQKPIANFPGCCPAPMGIATGAASVYLGVFDELLDFGSASHPTPPPTAVATGTVTVDGKPFVGGQIPYGARVDVSAGTIDMNTDLGPLTVYGAGGVSAQFLLARPNDSQIDIDLADGDFSVCKARSVESADKKKKKKVRLVWAKGKGKFRSAGRDSIASVHGTTWLTLDRCDGTLTTVKDGVVSVRDLRRRKTVTVRAGRSYLARHGRR